MRATPSRLLLSLLLLAASPAFAAGAEGAPPLTPPPPPPEVEAPPADVQVPSTPERAAEPTRPAPRRAPPSVDTSERRAGLLGVDSAQVTRWFQTRPIRVDEGWLAHAPTSPQVAMWSSIGTTFTGMAILTGVVINTALTFRPRMGIFWGAFAVSFLMINFGPNVGDLLNGDVKMFVLLGLARTLLTAVSAIVPYGIFGWVAMISLSAIGSRNAPARWVERNHPEAFAAPPPPRGF